MNENERLAKLEAIIMHQREDIEEIRENIKEIREMLTNGYIERKIQKTLHDMLGSALIKIIFTIMTSSVFLSWLISHFAR